MHSGSDQRNAGRQVGAARLHRELHIQIEELPIQQRLVDGNATAAFGAEEHNRLALEWPRCSLSSLQLVQLASQAHDNANLYLQRLHMEEVRIPGTASNLA